MRTAPAASAAATTISQLVLCVLRSAELCERLGDEQARPPLDEAKAARRGGARDRLEDRLGLGSLAAGEQDAALRFVEECLPDVEPKRSGSVHASLGLIEQAALDQRLDSNCERVVVGRKPSGVRHDLAGELDCLIDAAGFQSQPYLGTGVVDEVLELRPLGCSRKDCFGLRPAARVRAEPRHVRLARASAPCH